jgi:hypothetical protein
MQVDYSEPSWRETIRTEFGRILEFMAGVSDIPKNVALGASALNRQAAFQAIIAKSAEWAGEQEFRHVTLVAHSARDQLKSRPSVSGAKVYFPVVVRANNRPIAFAEILIGPNNTSAETQLRLDKLLAAAGYHVGTTEYPVVRPSAISPWYP